MRIKIAVSRLDELASPALVVGVPEGSVPGELSSLDARLDGLVSRIVATGALKGRTTSHELVYTLGKLPAERLLLAGLGKPEELDLKRLSDWAVRVTRRLRKSGIQEAALVVPEIPGEPAERCAKAVLEGVELGARDFRKYRTDNERIPDLEALTLVAPNEAGRSALEAGLRAGAAVAEGMSLARELGNEPANVATPSFLAERARAIAELRGLKLTVLGAPEMTELGMGALLGVARGSDEPPRFLVLELDTKRPGPTLALVGKGITFDAGGISLKPAARMHEMKFDMCGAGAVLGAMSALSQLEAKGKVIGLVPATENLPSGKAIKPGDVVKSMSGITIEVTNTDAEGRLILADAITYSRRFAPDAVIDVATLTGAIVVALGSHAIGLMGNDEALVDHVKASGFRTGERVWALPLWKEYLEHMRSDTADLNNSSKAGGGAITAAAFLSRFAEGLRWAHMDIAGTAWSEGEGERLVQGATGAGVRTLVETVLRFPGA